MPELYVTDWISELLAVCLEVARQSPQECSVACDLCGSYTCAVPRGKPLQGSYCCRSRDQCPSQGVLGDVVSLHASRSHLP